MSAYLVLGAVWRRALAASRVLGSFIAGLGIGSLLLVPVFGPIAMILAYGAAIFGFPSLVVAIALRLVFFREIGRRLLAWCLAAPFVAVFVMFAALFLLDYRQRGLNLVEYLVLEQNVSQAAIAAYFAAISSLVFYWWEGGLVRKAQASS